METVDALEGTGSMARTIVVTSNCQTFGIAAALAAIYPEDTIVPHHVSAPADHLPDFDMLVADNCNGNVKLLMERVSRPARVVKFCRVRFAGFHPDLCYLRRRSTGKSDGVYSSAIALWAYANGLNAAEAEPMFCGSVFRALGYFDCYDKSVERLRQDFADTDVVFGRFFLPMQRSGLFMHTYNHPKVAALVHLARQIADQIGLDGACADGDLSIADGLSAHTWPVYPEIAADLALAEGSYVWRLDGQTIRGVRDYLTATFARYEKQGIGRDDLDLVLVNGISLEAYDRVLGGWSGLASGRA